MWFLAVIWSSEISCVKFRRKYFLTEEHFNYQNLFFFPTGVEKKMEQLALN